MQISDAAASRQLQERLERLLQELLSSSRGDEKQLPPVNLNPGELLFLKDSAPQTLQNWSQELRLAQQKMLAQGVVATLAPGQLLQASWLQLGNLPEPNRRLGAKLITSSLQGFPAPKTPGIPPSLVSSGGRSAAIKLHQSWLLPNAVEIIVEQHDG